MTPQPSTTQETSHEIGKLCVGGDWACAQGDLAGLRQVARQLTAYVGEPIHCELEALVTACETAPHRATSLWDALKDRLYREVRA